MLGNIHGDIVTTVPIPATQAASTLAAGITGWSSCTEYGTPTDPAQTAVVGTSAGYGWLGTKMGVRYYNPVTGSFTSVDPVPGGNTTAYNYPTNPINQFDLYGRETRKNRIKRHIVAAAVCTSSPSTVYTLITKTIGSASRATKDKKSDNRANTVRLFSTDGLATLLELEVCCKGFGECA